MVEDCCEENTLEGTGQREEGGRIDNYRKSMSLFVSRLGRPLVKLVYLLVQNIVQQPPMHEQGQDLIHL